MIFSKRNQDVLDSFFLVILFSCDNLSLFLFQCMVMEKKKLIAVARISLSVPHFRHLTFHKFLARYLGGSG